MATLDGEDASKRSPIQKYAHSVFEVANCPVEWVVFDAAVRGCMIDITSDRMMQIIREECNGVPATEETCATCPSDEVNDAST